MIVIQPPQFDSVSFIMGYETGSLSQEEVVTGFQHLIDSGLVFQLQGSYQRMANDLILNGDCHEKLADVVPAHRLFDKFQDESLDDDVRLDPKSRSFLTYILGGEPEVNPIIDSMHVTSDGFVIAVTSRGQEVFADRADMIEFLEWLVDSYNLESDDVETFRALVHSKVNCAA